MEKFRLSPLAHCPACKGKLDGATPLETDKGPQPGDFSVCIYCHAVLRFEMQGEILTHRLSSLEEADENGLREELEKVIQMMEQTSQHNRISDPPSPFSNETYVKQIRQMSENAQAWRKANPDREAMVQFNYPKHVMLIAPISAAIKEKYVSVNEAGRELVQAMWPQDIESEPSVLMVRVALELPQS